MASPDPCSHGTPRGPEIIHLYAIRSLTLYWYERPQKKKEKKEGKRDLFVVSRKKTLTPPTRKRQNKKNRSGITECGKRKTERRQAIRGT